MTPRGGGDQEARQCASGAKGLGSSPLSSAARARTHLQGEVHPLEIVLVVKNPRYKRIALDLSGRESAFEYRQKWCRGVKRTCSPPSLVPAPKPNAPIILETPAVLSPQHLDHLAAALRHL
jgi:hypothetical protein